MRTYTVLELEALTAEQAQTLLGLAEHSPAAYGVFVHANREGVLTHYLVG